jgi:hypothetical protein
VLKPSISCDKPWGLLGRALTAMSSAANPKPKCSMPDATSTEAYARRWQALLAESSALHKEHMDLISSWTRHFRRSKRRSWNSSAARRDEINVKLAQLVDEWADARSA